ncbi:acyl-CoA carboxylase subunit epsilon [Streptomyces phaeochromogenes]|uniref:acyl-CoA carboxylase subunit epsilon n=1 Tax=Streptomyces phaeochromogenes TaxID=1923 RepID=UPI0033EEA0E9
MEGIESKGAWLRIERGHATEEEVAAVTVTLLSLAAGRSAARAEGAGCRSAAPWGRPGRTRIHRTPRSWR